MSQKRHTGWERLFQFTIHNKVLVLIPAAMLVLGGLVAVPFDWQLGGLPHDPVAVDAIPDTGENQQIVFAEWPGRSPIDVEDQITYPLTTLLLSVPDVATVRSQSMFGFSSIYVIFSEDAGFYWSRARLLERLSSLPAGTLPDGVSPRLGPEATALGQIFWYTLQGRDPDGRVVGGWDPDELRSVQDWTVRYALQSVDGVAEVASVGGYVREYQVDVDPEALVAHGVTLAQVARAVAESNQDIGARTLEINRAEYVVRSRGFITGPVDLERAVVTVRDNVPIRVGDVARVMLGPADRRGALDDAGAEAVGGVVVARYGANPMAVIDAVKRRLADIAPTLPARVLADGTVSRVTVVPFYDRTQLIDETIDTLGTALWQQIVITVLVVLILLRHLRSSALIAGLVPIAVIASFAAMKLTGVDANVMSLAGIAIAIGTMVDIGIVLVENIVRSLDEAPRSADRAAVIREAAAEVAPAVLTSVATTIVSFLPVFALTAAEGKLFRPLAFTKTYALAGSVILGIALLPVLAHVILTREPVPVPVPPGTGRRRDRVLSAVRTAARAAVRPQHAGDWLIATLGVVVAVAMSPVVGAMIAMVGVGRLIQPVLPGRWSRAPAIAEVAVFGLAAVVLLTDDWRPLASAGAPGGATAGLAVNLVFVAGIVGAVLGVFALFQRLYPRILRWCLDNKGVFLLLPGGIMVAGVTVWLGFSQVFGWLPGWVDDQPFVRRAAASAPGFSREFMPPLDEGSYLVMPVTMPHASLGQALELLSQLDAALAAIPEVDRVVGKLGRVDSPLDPAPVSMYEVLVTYVPEYGVGPGGERVRNWRDHIRTPDDIWDELAAASALPGLTRVAELMPIETRRLMLQTGMRGTIGVRILGPDLASLERAALALEDALRAGSASGSGSGPDGGAAVAAAIPAAIPAIRSETVAAERVVGKPYLEIDLDREAIARHGLAIGDVQALISIALGGRTLTRTIEGRERYPVRVRYLREDRDSPESLARIVVSTPGGEQVPLGQLARFEYVRGPQVIKAENTFKAAYVTFGKRDGYSDVDAVDQARAHLQRLIAAGELTLPPGVSYEFAGSYENQVRSERRLALLIPVALSIVFFLLYLQFRSALTSVIVYTGVAVAVAGGFVLVWLYAQPWFLDFSLLGVPMRQLFGVGTINMSVAVWVGVIALIGIATDDGVVMATYLDQQFGRGPLASIGEIRDRVLRAGQRRVRACLMTTATTLLALLPVVTSHGRGADVMVPMAIPVLGGMAIELITLFVVPVLYSLVRELEWRARGGQR